MRRTLLLLLSFAACEPPDSPVAPTLSGTPSFAVVHSPGDLLGSTNAGELVTIDLTTGTVALIGDAGIFAGKNLGWTGLAFDQAGNLFTTSRNSSELTSDGCTGFYGGGRCSHLYRVDASTGAVIADIGSTNRRFISDIEFGGGTLYGSSYTNQTADCCGALLTIDPTTAQISWVNFPNGFGPNATLSAPIQNGGLAVHPITGEIWGIENGFAAPPLLFKIDPVTGIASDLMKIGLGGVQVTEGFDALEILPNGRFLATRGGPGLPAAERLYEIAPFLDPNTGFAEITLVPLSYSTALAGHINGLEVVPSGAAIGLQVSCPPTVPRGQGVTCTATAPGTGLVGTTLLWSFRPDTVRMYPNSTVSWTQMDVTEVSRPGVVDSTWVGDKMVHSGMVFVAANGGVDLDSAYIDVQSRNWGALPVDTVPSLIGQFTLPWPGGTVAFTGGVAYGPDLTAFPARNDHNVVFTGGYVGDQATSGPNEGYQFIASTTFEAPRGYSINGWIFPGAPYPSGGTTVGYVQNQQQSPDSALFQIHRHEASGLSGQGSTQSSHFNRWRRAANSFTSCGNLYAALERLTAADAASLDIRVNTAKTLSLRTMNWAGDHPFVHGFIISGTAYAADWVTRPNLVTLDPDLPQAPDPTKPAPDSSVCNVSGL